MVTKILDSIKVLLGISSGDENFDEEIMMHINSVFSILEQLGVPGEENFQLEDGNELWTDYLPEEDMVPLIKSYIYYKVRLLFDPPQNSFLVNSMQKLTEEFEWRIHVMVEPYAAIAAAEAEEAEDET
jgi:hypothetical protein